MTKRGTLIAQAPEELRHVISKVKMNTSKAESMRSLGAVTINTEMLGKTLAYLMDIEVTDNNITRLLKEGKKDMIVRTMVNLMPLPCLTCNHDIEFKPTDKPQVRCKRCDRGACTVCFPEPKNGWAYLCKICDADIEKQECIPEAMLKKVGREEPPGSQVQTQNVSVTLGEGEDDTDVEGEEEEEEEEEDELEEAARLRAEKRKNENGGRRSRSQGGGSKSQEGGDRSKEKEKEICKAFKFGGKCPHGMGGLKKHN